MFSLTGIKAKIAECVLCVLLCVFAYNYIGYKAVEQYKIEQQAEQAKADKKQQEKYDKLAADYEQLKITRAQNAKVIERKVETIIREPIYTTKCIDDSGLQLANEAISGSTSTSIPASALPAAK